ncbi:MAG TPA: TonB-dependent receptor [Sphingobium sp.]
MRSIFLAGAALAALLPAVAFAQDASPAPDGADHDVIVVTASPFKHGVDDTPAIVTKIDSATILRSGGSSIADALSETPGIAASGFAAGASRPIIRGMDSTRVRILENGTSSSDVADIGPDHGVPIDPLAARSIEVVRGAATLRYGSQAIGGVVNVLNDRVPTALPQTPLNGELTGSFDSVSDTWQGSALADVAVGNVALHADGFVRDAGDYGTPLGTQANSFFRGHGVSLGGSLFFGDGGDSRIGAAITQYNAKYGIPADTPYIDMRQTKVMVKSSFALGDGLLKSLDLDGSYADYAHDEKNPDGSINTTFLNKEYNARSELVFNRIGFIENTALGVEYQHRDFSALGVDASYLFPAAAENVAGYLFADTHVLPGFHLELSGRVEHARFQGTPADGILTTRDFTPVSGAIGALVDVGQSVKLGLTFSSTGRAPALTEMFARGGHDGPGTFETGDPNLGVERANSLEGTLRIRSGPFHFDGSVYSSWFHNFIYGDLTGRTCDDEGLCSTDPDGELRELNYRQQGAHFRGVEAQATYLLLKAPGGALRAKLLGDYTRATLDDGNNVPRIPPWRIGGGLDWQGKAVDAGFTLIYAGRQDKPGAFDTPTPGYVSLGAQLAWRPFKDHPGVELAIVGQNLTNEVQRDASAFNKDEVLAPGRNVRLVLKVASF